MLKYTWIYIFSATNSDYGRIFHKSLGIWFSEASKIFQTNEIKDEMKEIET